MAIDRDALTENSLACVVLLVAAYDWRNIVLRGKHVVIARVHCGCDLALASGVAALARRPDILAGADMMCGVGWVASWWELVVDGGVSRQCTRGIGQGIRSSAEIQSSSLVEHER